MLIEKIYAAKQAKSRLSPCHTNRASEAGHACDRYLVLRRTRWQEAALPDVRLQLLFDEGNLQEQAVLRDLAEAGWTVIEQQRDYEWKALQLTGHIDGKVLLDGEAVPIEIKSMAPWIWDAITSMEDFDDAPRPWLRKYPAQMQLYLLLSNSPRGFLILKNKATGQLKELEVALDYEKTEAVLARLERVNEHVKAGTEPPPIVYDEHICGACPFYQRACQPEVLRTALDWRDDAKLAEKLERREALAPAKREYEQLDKEIKAACRGIEKAVCGEWLITGKPVTRKAYTVESTTSWVTTIQRIQQEDGSHV